MDARVYLEKLALEKRYAGDTMVIIDISWPLPENLTWNLGSVATILMENKDYVEVVFDRPGTFTIDVEVALADCRDFYSQAISILGEREGNIGGKMASNTDELIRLFNIFPNPGWRF